MSHFTNTGLEELSRLLGAHLVQVCKEEQLSLGYKVGRSVQAKCR